MPTQSPLALYPHQLREVKNFPLSRARGLLWGMRLGKSPPEEPQANDDAFETKTPHLP